MIDISLDRLDPQQLIVDKAMEDLKREEQEKAQEKKRILEERVPPLDLDNLSQGDIVCFMFACMVFLYQRCLNLGPKFASKLKIFNVTLLASKLNQAWHCTHRAINCAVVDYHFRG